MDKDAANWWAIRSKQLRYWYKMSASYSLVILPWMREPANLKSAFYEGQFSRGDK